MAANPPAAEAAQPDAKKGGKKKLLIIIVAAVVVLAGAGAGLFFSGILGGGHSESAEGEEGKGHGEEEVKAQTKVRPTVALKEFVVNLADAEQARYLKVVIELEVTNAQIATSCEASQSAIRNTLVELLSSKVYSEIRDIKGKAKLRQEIIVRVNEILGVNGVTQVFFTEFIVQ